MEITIVLYQRNKMELLEFYYNNLLLNKIESRLLLMDLHHFMWKMTRTSTMKIALDHNFEEDILPIALYFDILVWWKLNWWLDVKSSSQSTSFYYFRGFYVLKKFKK
ncbi:hypothetical protein CR513_56324, partial [Mucuna pruriens]